MTIDTDRHAPGEAKDFGRYGAGVLDHLVTTDGSK